MENIEAKINMVNLPKALSELIKNHIKNPSEIEFGEGSEKLLIKVSQAPSPSTRANAIVNAANLMFSDFNNGIDGFMPAFSEFAHKYGVLSCYTNFEIPQELDYAWHVVNYTPIYDKVAEIVGDDEIFRFRYQLDDLINAHKEERIHMININQIIEHFTKIIDNFAAKFKNLDLKETLHNLENLPGLLQNLPKEFSSGGIGNLIKTFFDSKNKQGNNMQEKR